ncbi:MAG: tetratricopeptide repeat protein [Novosphingobium sp.]|nr:tetratricopeptide repeat protein [Novosphingobium sp.]
MTVSRPSPSSLRFALAGTLAAVMLAGCAGGGHVQASAAPPQTALGRGQVTKAISRAETAVQRSPRNAAARATLAQAYLTAGRFDSAAATFRDAIELGDASGRTALGLALSDVASGHDRDAVAVLDNARDVIPAGDLGLALALAGETGRGVAVLSDAVRAGDSSPTLRQNLAYAFALDGRWREARLMVAQDMPADQVDARLGQWALSAKPEAFHERVAVLLGSPLVKDPGQPQALALANSPSVEQLAAEAAPSPAVAPAPAVVAATPLPPSEPAVAVAAPQQELPPVATPASAPAPLASATAFAAPPSLLVDANRQPAPIPAALVTAHPTTHGLMAQAVVQPLHWPKAQLAPAHTAAPAAFVAPAHVASGAGSHVVQLGAFSSAENAKRALQILPAHNAALRHQHLVITEAVVRGRTYWRVAAVGFDGASATGLCSSLKAHGGACWAYAVKTAPGRVPGADGAPELARR